MSHKKHKSHSIFKIESSVFFRSETRWYCNDDDLFSPVLNLLWIVPAIIVWLVFSLYTVSFLFDEFTGMISSSGQFGLAYVFTLMVSAYLSGKYYPWFFPDLWMFILWGGIFFLFARYIILNW